MVASHRSVGIADRASSYVVGAAGTGTERDPTRDQYQVFLDQVPSDWKIRPLGAIAKIVGGGTPSRDCKAFWNGDILWVTPGEVSKEESKHLTSTTERITSAGLAGSGANLLPIGALMVTTRATLGARAIVSVPMATNQGFKSLVFPSVEDADFYFYLTPKFRPELVRRASGTTFLEISSHEFAQIEVPCPPRQEKYEIARVLDTLDTTIRQTEAIIAKLKQVKQGLLHDLLTRGIDANGELRPPQSQAPHLYKQSPLGWIPKEWGLELLDNVAVRGSGHTPSKSVRSYWNDGVKWVSLADSHRLDQIYIDETDKQISDLGIANSSAVKHPMGTVILSRDAGIGKSAILASEMAVSQHFIAWRCGERLNNLFLYFNLQRLKPTFEAIAMGSTIKTIGLPFFKRFEVAIPARDEQDRTVEILLAAERSVEKEEQELAKLLEQKAGLMDDLLTGRVRVNPLLALDTPPTGPKR